MKNFSRIRISNDATTKLKTLKGRTGLTPNLLCRMALCHSLEGQKITQLVELPEDGQEFNRYTLTGEYDAYFIALIKERCRLDGMNPEENFMKYFKAHLNNGIMTIYSRLNDLSDLPNLLR